MFVKLDHSWILQGAVRKETERFELLKNVMLIYATVKL